MSNEAARHEASFQTIRSASSPAELRKARIAAQNRLYEQFNDTGIQEWNGLANELHHAVMSRASAICEQELIEEGVGPPPAPYAFVVFGSAGRAEQTLWSDQDNGLIIGEGDEEASSAYFDKFGPMLSRLLEAAGYPPCPGNVMLSNSFWRKTVADWERQLKYWRGLLGWEQVRYLMIAADMRHIYGDEELTKLLRNKMTAVFDSDGEPEYDLTAAVLRNTIRHKAALNALGQVITEQTGEHMGGFDVKYGLYLPIVNAVRYLSIEYGIVASTTQERMEQLYRLDAAQLRWLDSCQHAFNIALRFRSMATAKDEGGLLIGTNYLSESLIRQKETRRELREALSTVKLMYRSLQRQHRYVERKWL